MKGQFKIHVAEKHVATCKTAELALALVVHLSDKEVEPKWLVSYRGHTIGSRRSFSAIIVLEDEFFIARAGYIDGAYQSAAQLIAERYPEVHANNQPAFKRICARFVASLVESNDIF